MRVVADVDLYDALLNAVADEAEEKPVEALDKALEIVQAGDEDIYHTVMGKLEELVKRRMKGLPLEQDAGAFNLHSLRPDVLP